MADRTLTVNGQPFTFNRDRFAGVRTMTVTVDELPLTDATTSIQVTVAGHSDISGIYTGTTVAGATWTQQGGAGTIAASNFNATDGYEYLIQDSDSDPQILLNTGAGFTDRPWKAVIPSAITITGIAGTETVTVDRTASVIDSDRKGESRPLLSKVVGGAAAAYSLRDLNDKAGNNKVVEVRRSSGGSRKFLAKEVSNGTLTAWVGAGNDGFVETWYDQSGNSNDAVQAVSTEQPKIVSAGSLMLNDDGHPAIGFQRLSSGSTNFDLTTGIDIANSHSFQYVEFQKTYTYTLVQNSAGGSNRIGYLTGSQLRLYRGGSLNFGAGTTITNNPFIYTTFLAADGSASKVNVNGDEVLNQVLGNGTGGTTFNAIFRGDNAGLASQFTKLSELIVYDTDQSANRPAIEANINNQYDIY